MPSDQDLLAAYARSSDDGALAALLQRHGRLVHATCWRIIGDHHDAEEAAQAVFLVLARKARGLGEVSCLSAWLHRTARYVAVKQRSIRLRQRRRERSLAVGGPEATAPVTAERDEQAQAIDLDAALKRVPELYREPIILHYLEGMSCQAIGERLTISAELVSSRLSRGRDCLRRSLGPRSGAHMDAVLAAAGSEALRAPERPLAGPATQSMHALAKRCLQAKAQAVHIELEELLPILCQLLPEFPPPQAIAPPPRHGAPPTSAAKREF